MMRARYWFFALFLLMAVPMAAQTSDAEPDTSDYPYWIEMMDDTAIPVPAVSRAFDIYWKGREVTRGSGWKPFKRWEYYHTMRMHPDGSRATNAELLQAWEETQVLRQKESSGGQWQILGPVQQPPIVNSGQPNGLGRVNALAFDPMGLNVIYAGSASGGLWKTTNAGQTWQALTDALPTLGVSSILVDPVNSSVLYMGTGDRDHGDAPGLGVWKSTDGGVNWTASNTGMGNLTVGDMVFQLNDNSTIIAATGAGIYKSINAGSSWQLAESGNFKDLDRHPANPSILYATASGKFYRSADTGSTWNQVGGIPVVSRMMIGTTPAAPGYVYLVLTNNNSFNSLYRSTDAGLTFSERSNSPNIMDWSTTGSGSGGQAWYDLAMTVDPFNANVLYVGGVNVFKSNDGGTTWQINSHWTGSGGNPAVHADCHWLGYSPFGRLYAGNDGGVYHTDNGGSNWTEITSGLAISQIYKIGQSLTQRDRVMAGYQDNGTTVYNPSGWLTVAGGDGMEAAVDPTNAAYTYGSYYNGDIYRLTNDSYNGTIAGDGNNGMNEGGAWVTPFLVSLANPNTMFVGMVNVWRSNNIKNLSVSTVTWTKLDNGLSSGDCLDLEQSPADPDILYVSKYNNTLFRTDDAHGSSVSFTNLTGNLPHSGLIRSIETHPLNPEIVYILQDRKVFRSADRGSTWTDLTANLPDVPMSDLVYYSRSQEGLYLGTDIGVFYRDAYTNGWISFSTGLPAAIQISEMEIWYDPLSGHGDRIRASSFGRGVWESGLYQTQPTADFVASKTLLPKGCSIDFTDLSSGIPDNWQWTFYGASPDTSSQMNPQGITYPIAGTYAVKLVVWNTTGTDSISKIAYISVSDSLLPEPAFNANRRYLCSSDAIATFSDQSGNCPDAWLWSFSPDSVTFLNGTSSGSANPSIRFDAPGTYDLSLTVWNQNGPSIIQVASFINVGGATPAYDHGFEVQSITDEGWTVDNPDDDHTWEIWDLGSLGKAAGIRIFNTNSLDHTDRLISPPFNLEGLANASLQFSYAYAQYQTGYSDSLRVYVSADCGNNWTRIFSRGEDGSGNFATHAPTTSMFVPANASDWCGISGNPDCITLDLGPWTGMKDVRIAFESYSYLSNNLYIDDVRVNPFAGISDSPEKERLTLSVWPNPANNLLNFIIPQHGAGKVTLTDVLGSVVYSRNDDFRKDETHTIGLAELPSGIYILTAIIGVKQYAARVTVQ